MYAICPSIHLDASILVSQSSEETGIWQSMYWTAHLNSGGLGIDYSGKASPFTLKTGAQAAHVHTATMWVMLGNTNQLPAAIADADGLSNGWLDRVRTMVGDRNRPTVRTIHDLCLPFHSVITGNQECTWACDDSYATNICDDHANRMFPNLPDAGQPSPGPVPGPGPQPGPQPVPQPSELYAGLPFPVAVEIIPPGQTRQRTGIKMVPELIVQHETGDPSNGAGARSTATWQANGAQDDNGNSQDLSVHFYVDDHQAIQCLPLDEVGWHAACGLDCKGATAGIAIECCVNADGDYERARDNCARLSARLLKRVIKAAPTDEGTYTQHNFWYPGRTKDCPQQLRDRKLWPDQVARVQGYYAAEGGTPAPSPQPVPPPNWDGEDHGDFKALRRNVHFARDCFVYQRADPSSVKLGGGKKGDEFQMDWIVKSKATGTFWYVRQDGGRIRASDCVEQLTFSDVAG